MSARQRLFVETLARDPARNATRAARKAGFSAATARETAYKLLREDRFAHVAAAYHARRAEVLEERRLRMQCSDEQLVQYLEAIAFHDPRDIYELRVERRRVPDGEQKQGEEVKFRLEERQRLVLKDTRDLWPDQAVQLAGIKERPGRFGTTFDVSTVPPAVRLQALRTLAEMRGLIGGDTGGADWSWLDEVFIDRVDSV